MQGKNVVIISSKSEIYSGLKNLAFEFGFEKVIVINWLNGKNGAMKIVESGKIPNLVIIDPEIAKDSVRFDSRCELEEERLRIIEADRTRHKEYELSEYASERLEIIRGSMRGLVDIENGVIFVRELSKVIDKNKTSLLFHSAYISAELKQSGILDSLSCKYFILGMPSRAENLKALIVNALQI